MSIDKKFKLIDITVFVLLISITIMAFFNNRFSNMIDAFFLPEERNKAYYDILNNPSKIYESKELAENGTKNLLANYLKSGDRESGYFITVNSDGTFLFSGKYTGEKDTYEALTPTGVGFDMPSGDYVLSDGGASSEDNVFVKLTGARRMIGGGTEYQTLAYLPGNGSFHWDRDPDLEIYCEIVVRPEASSDGLKFSPMLLKAEDVVSQEYQPCYNAKFDWEENKTEEGVQFFKYDIHKGALDGEIITRDDWKIFSNSLKYRMQVDRLVIDLKDGYGIEIMKKDFPMATYGKLNVSMAMSEVQKINITDCDEVIRVINSESESTGSNGNESGEALSGVESELKDIRDFYSYLKALDNEDYTILLSVRDDGVAALNREIMELLYRLGLETNLMEHEEGRIESRKYFQNSFCSVLRHGKAEDEKFGEEKLTLSGKLSDGTEYIIESAGQKTEEANASIIIDGNEYAMNLRGMNFVIYDEMRHSVVDSVCFDSGSGFLCHRQAEQ